MSDTSATPPRTSTRALGAIAASGFVVLVVLIVVFVVTEENLVGSAAGVVAILTGIALGLWLVRSDGHDEAER
jgi:hypothetical protein